MNISECKIRDVVAVKNIRIIQPVNIYECTLHDDVFIGPFVEIQKNCIIGKRCRIQSHTFICENVVIGAGSVVIKPITVKGIYAGNPARLLRLL